MRFLIHEQGYERPLAAGTLTYSNGAQELWRLTQATTHTFLRVDLDGRAGSGDSYLYHAVLNEHNQLERLMYRFWNANFAMKGNLLVETDQLTHTRELPTETATESVPFSTNHRFWFPASMGLSLLQGEGAFTGYWLQRDKGFSLGKTTVSLTHASPDSMTIRGQEHPVIPITIKWNEQERAIWRDPFGTVLRMERGATLTAVATRYIRYRITSPNAPAR